jgi:tryptophan 2,3-dioxygenase
MPDSNSKDTTNPPVTYSSYLKVEELLSLQQMQSDPPAQDEMLFIIVHQTSELWFKQIIFDVGYLIRAMEKDDLVVTVRMMDRVCEIFRVLIHQIEILETMTPVSFNRFRSRLNPASGFQSLQFRELELLSGMDPKDYQALFALSPEWKHLMGTKPTQKNLRQAFFELLESKKLLRQQNNESIAEALTQIYSDAPEHMLLQDLCERLIRYDEQFSLWRFRHVQMVERMIGRKPGTGGSLGAAYLTTTLKKKFFPELWELRTHLGAGIEYGKP